LFILIYLFNDKTDKADFDATKMLNIESGSNAAASTMVGTRFDYSLL
jgi:hypothetical protein